MGKKQKQPAPPPPDPKDNYPKTLAELLERMSNKNKEKEKGE
jgi:rRNA maturation protein Nop10